MSISRIHDPTAGGDIEVNLQIAGDGLYIFDPNGKRLYLWPYAEIVNAISAGASMDHVLARQGRPEIRLSVGEIAFYETIAGRAPQLRRNPRLFKMVLQGIPEQILTGLIVIALALVLIGSASLVAVFD